MGGGVTNHRPYYNPVNSKIMFRPREGQQRKAHSDSEDLQRMARPDASEGHAQSFDLAQGDISKM